MTIDTRNIPGNVYDASLGLPNVYFVTVNTASHGAMTLYIAADYSGAAIQKVRRHFRDQHGLALYRSNSDIKMRRFRLGDYLENPQGLQEAGENALMAHERDTAAKLATRQEEVNELLAQLATAHEDEGPADMDWAVIEAQLGEALRSA